ncbi:iron-sulfur cluster-binding protein [Aquifex sp.]
MYKVIKKEKLTPSAVLLEIEDSRAKLVKPGQYALVQFREDSEPIPLSFLEVKESSYTFLVEAVGRATLEIVELLEDGFSFIEAPCGSPFPVEEYGKVLLISKNWGIAPLINVGKALRERGNEVYFIHVGENEEKVFLTEKAADISEEFLLFTEDGSLGEEGNTDWALRYFLDNFVKPDLVVSAGSNIDSQMVCEVAKEKELNHIAMVNAHILDANGLCLACRVLIEGEEKLACLDGPWFDGKKVNWDYAIQKEFFYRDEEKKALEAFMKELRRIKAKRGN